MNDFIIASFSPSIPVFALKKQVIKTQGNIVRGYGSHNEILLHFARQQKCLPPRRPSTHHASSRLKIASRLERGVAIHFGHGKKDVIASPQRGAAIHFGHGKKGVIASPEGAWQSISSKKSGSPRSCLRHSIAMTGWGLCVLKKSSRPHQRIFLFPKSFD